MKIMRECARHFLIFTNLLFLILATILIVMGGLMAFNVYQWIPGVENQLSLLIIGFGCFIFFFGFLGLYGAIREDNSCSLIYSIVMLTLLALELLALFYTYYDKEKISQATDYIVKISWKHEENGDADFMNILQSGLNCCGVNNSSDYKKALPKSCTIEPKRSHKKKIGPTQTGCKKAAKDFVLQKLHIFQYILIAVAGLQALIFYMGCLASGGDDPEDIEFLSILH